MKAYEIDPAKMTGEELTRVAKAMERTAKSELLDAHFERNHDKIANLAGACALLGIAAMGECIDHDERADAFTKAMEHMTLAGVGKEDR